MNRDELRDRYIAAFRAANPHKEAPALRYENGWWLISYRMTGGIPQRSRQAKLIEMMIRLQERADK
jgi:hypothetical protein